MTGIQITRESVIKDVINIFIETLGYLSDDEKKMVNQNTHIIQDFNVADIDSMAFEVALVKNFSVKPTNKEWGEAALLCEIADVIIKKMNKNP